MGGAPHADPHPDILSPWCRRLSLPIPCHVHWPRSCYRRRARAAAVCKEACFRGRAGCVPGHVCSGCSCVQSALVRRGCAAGAWAPAWVRGGGAWRRGRVSCVSRVPSCSDADACRRWLGERVGSWASWCLPSVRGRSCVGVWAGGGVWWLFRGFYAGRRLGHYVTTKVGAGALQKGY